MEKSVYELITDLAEKHVNKRKCLNEGIEISYAIKKLRASAFDVLLKNKHTTEHKNELINNSDAICHLLAWQYTLRNELDQSEKAEALNILINKLEDSNILNNPDAHNIIIFLLYLRGSKPEKTTTFTSDIFNKVTLKNKIVSNSRAFGYEVYSQQRFNLPQHLHVQEERKLKTYSSEIFTTEPKLKLTLKSKSSYKLNKNVSNYRTNFKFEPLYTSLSKPRFHDFNDNAAVHDEGYISPTNVKEDVPKNIWEIALKTPLSKHKTWESLDTWIPPKELPFACESGPKTLHHLQFILDSNIIPVVENAECIEQEIITSTYFIKCVKFMLVGMSSDVFLTNDKDLFFLKDAVTIEGLSSQALISYSEDLIISGSCYRALNKLCCMPNSYKDNEKYGYVFKELCESIKRYLAFYRVAALSVPDTANLLKVHHHMRPLKQQITTLARICKVAHYKGGTILQGAELLNYIYQEITNAVDNNVVLVLYSAFYPCCQIYFSRFLQRWLFEGVLIDPYEEFIVKSDSNNNSSRTRIYWTRGFSLRHNYIPEFLSELKNDILHCGKTMNLLKLCNPDAALYTHIMSREIPLISCCLTSEHSRKLNQEIDCYYIEMASLCGPRISLYHYLRDRYGFEDNVAFASLVEKKRALTFKEIELRKQHEAEEKAKMKRKIFEEMKEQMNLAAEQKKKVKEDALKEDLLIAQQNAQIEELRSKLVKEESSAIIKYYNTLIETVDKRRKSLESRKLQLSDDLLNLPSIIDENKNTNAVSETGSSEDIFLSPKSTLSDITISNLNTDRKSEIDQISDENKNVESTEPEITKPETVEKDLDLVNANETAQVEMYNQINENHLAAQRNRAKVLNLEFGFTEEKKKHYTNITKNTPNLSEAQRNRLRVLNSEYDIFYDSSPYVEPLNVKKEDSFISLVDKNEATTSDKPSFVLTNENTNNSNENIYSNPELNLASPGHEDIMNIAHRKKILKLPKQSELLTIYEKTQNDAIPMSVDSTPNTEIFSDLQTPSSAKLSLNTDINLDTPSVLDSGLLTATSNYNEEGFKFPTNDNTKKFSYDTGYKLLFAGKQKICSIMENVPKKVRPMRISKEEVEAIKNGNLKYLLYQSVYIPLAAQMKLVNSEILKYFIHEQNYFSHLHSLRSYYFILDGEFGRSITEGLFTKLYDSKNPTDLLNLRSLQFIIEQALFASSKIQENGDRLSFIVKNIPKAFDLGNADVFECLSLSYRINWPLNVLLPFETIEKYDLVFKYLLKLHYVSWVLQKMVMELKNIQKEYGIEETVLLNSPQYHKIQLYRHIMTHFIHTLQNYTVSEVLQTSWEELENNLKSVNTIDQLYNVHVTYLKTTIFRSLLNKKCAPIMKVIREIFVVILKFYNYLRSRSWNLKEKDVHYTHPNFKKLEDIFHKFQEFANFVYRVGNKMARVGYQPHLIQMLDMLNVNDYYTSLQKY